MLSISNVFTDFLYTLLLWSLNIIDAYVFDLGSLPGDLFNGAFD